ncbi:MAG TPA: diacylglycerol kinase family protein [Chthoniobacterales bacterium]|jgi:diacylglycerol kinase family enzyme
MIVILNRGAGRHQDETQAQIEKFFRSRDIAAQMLVARGGGEIARLAAEAAHSDAGVIVAAGGDGTVDGVASALAGTGKILGVIPLGTFNLLARRLNIPLDLEGALQTAVNGRVTKINVGEVNGRVFLSRSSVGLYPLALRQRERMYRRFGRSRLIALLSGATALMRWGNIMTIRLTTEKDEHLFRSRFVFVCNNPAELEYFNLPGRQCIDADKFAVYVPRPVSPPGLLRLGFRMLRRQTQESRDFDTFCSREMRFEIKPSRLPVSLDGEVEIMQSPLHYRLRLGALRIRLPSANPEQNQSNN